MQEAYWMLSTLFRKIGIRIRQTGLGEMEGKRLSSTA